MGRRSAADQARQCASSGCRVSGFHGTLAAGAEGAIQSDDAALCAEERCADREVESAAGNERSPANNIAEAISVSRGRGRLVLRRNTMVRAFSFDVGPVVDQLDRILQMELAGVIYYTHYSFMVYGHARIPITSWLRGNATESLTHAQEAGEMIMQLHKRPALGIAALPTTRHNTIDEIITC